MKAIVAIISTLVTLNVAEPPPPSSYQTSPLLGLNINSVLSNSYAPAPAPIRSSYGAPSSEYGAPPPEEQPQQPPPQEQYGPPQEQYGPPPPQQYGAPVKTGPIVHRHVYIHSAPDEVSYPESKIIRVGGEPEKHVNIIFVKAPSASSQSQTELILPEMPQTRTLVYVLVKKSESTNNVRVSGPKPTKPAKPEVYFIRYKGNEGGYSSPAPAVAYGQPEVKSGYN